MMKISPFVLFTVLATINVCVAQSDSSSSSDGSQSGSHNHANFFGFPLPFDFSQLPFFGGQREAEVAAPDAPAADENGEEEGLQNRFFFSLFSPSTFVSCNSTTQAGATCTSCTTALSCGSNNVGRQQTCRGLHPYCNVGRCSFFPGELCANATG